jgi:hypothetical protein
MAFLSLPAFAEQGRRAALPGGGEIVFPARYEAVADDDYRYEDTGGRIAFRNHRSMMSGTSECDGMISVARIDQHTDLDAFVMASRAMLTTRWSVADETEGRWYGKEDTRLPVTRRDGPDGPELSGPLSVHIVGFFGVYDKPGRFFAIETGGLRIAVWIFESHGGEKQARKIAAGIVKSHSGAN